VWGSSDWIVPAVALTAVVLGVLVWSYLRGGASWGVRLSAACFKTLGITALGLCLLEPLFSGTRPRPGANLFILLADDSQSMQIHDPGVRKSRGEILRRCLFDESPWNTRLEQDFDVRRYAFAERLRGLENEEELNVQGTGSSMITSLETIARRFRGRPIAGVLLLTDGNATDLSDELPDLAELPPIYPVVFGTRDPAPDVAVGQVTVTQTNFEETPVTIRAEITGDGYEEQKLRVQLLDDADEVVQEQTLEPGEAGKPRVARFRLRPERGGLAFYRVRAAAESEQSQFDAPQESVEATLANNTKLVAVETPGGPFRVLYVAGRPNWEFKFLRRAVAEDHEVELVGLIRVAKREPKFNFLGRSGETTNPLYKGFTNQDDEQAEQYDEPVLIRLGTRDQAELRDGFPQSADLLNQYHAVILDDLEAGFFTQERMLLLQKFVSRRGGGLLMLGGAESFRSGDYARTPIGELLPVYLDRVAPPAEDAAYRLSLSREGWLQPWVRLRETEDAERHRLEAMPPFQTVNRVPAVKPGATVLAYVTDGEENRLPALVAQRFGKGRAAALLVGDLWRWQLKRETPENDDLAKAWRQTVRWLVADVPGRIELEARPSRGGEAAPVEMRIRVKSPEFEPLDNAAAEVALTTPQGETLKLRAEPSDLEAGTYVAHYLPRSEGAYRAKAVVTAPDGSLLGEQETGWTAQPGADEFHRLAANLPLLERLAKESGGEVVARDRLDEFVADLPNRKIPITEPWIYPLWHRPFVFLLAIGCLMAEWGLRRVKGLP
jgi:uncharacterized membrane protein